MGKSEFKRSFKLELGQLILSFQLLQLGLHIGHQLLGQELWLHIGLQLWLWLLHLQLGLLLLEVLKPLVMDLVLGKPLPKASVA